MRVTHDDGPVVSRVRNLVAPIASDLGLDLYDVEQRGDTLRVTLDTPAGFDDRCRPRHARPGHPPRFTRPRPRGSVARPLHAGGHEPRRRALPAHARSLPARARQDPQRASRRCRQRPAPARGSARRRRRILGDAPDRRPRHRWNDRTGHHLRPDRPRQDGVRVGSQAEAGWVEAARHDPATARANTKPRKASPERVSPERASKEKQSS